jgi:DNA-binding NarL/FixJ family response regulator
MGECRNILLRKRQASSKHERTEAERVAILILTSEGMGARQIGPELKLYRYTVEEYRRRTLQKLGADKMY